MENHRYEDNIKGPVRKRHRLGCALDQHRAGVSQCTSREGQHSLGQVQSNNPGGEAARKWGGEAASPASKVENAEVRRGWEIFGYLFQPLADRFSWKVPAAVVALGNIPAVEVKF